MDKHHHRVWLASLVTIVVTCAVLAGGYWAYWNFYARFSPITISKNQSEIQQLLDEADSVAPGRTGPVIYMLTYRDCQPCTDYQREEFPKLAAANVDTRVIIFARPDREGLSQSTPTERATVAELWINRDWDLYARWMATPHREWTAEGIRPADKDFARTAVVNATRDYVNQLVPLLKGAGLGDTYPLLIWRDRDGLLKACACTDARSYHFILSDLGAPRRAPLLPPVATPAPAAPASAAPPASTAAPTPATAAPPPPSTPVAASAPAAADAPASTAAAPPSAPASNAATPAAAGAKPAAAQVRSSAAPIRRRNNPRAVFY
jgi:hypothetical protein